MGIDGSVWIDDAGQEIVAGRSVAHGLLGWGLTWETPSVFVGVSADLATHETVASLLENESWEECYEYEDAHYLGAYNRYVVCGRVVGSCSPPSPRTSAMDKLPDSIFVSHPTYGNICRLL
jgi:hypothetical protein